VTSVSWLKHQRESSGGKMEDTSPEGKNREKEMFRGSKKVDTRKRGDDRNRERNWLSLKTQLIKKGKQEEPLEGIKDGEEKTCQRGGKKRK